jgi:hypothetical protein
MIASGLAQSRRISRAFAPVLTMTKGDGECHGCVKSDAFGNRSASLLSVSRVHPKLAGNIRIACALF